MDEDNCVALMPGGETSAHHINVTSVQMCHPGTEEQSHDLWPVCLQVTWCSLWTRTPSRCWELRANLPDSTTEQRADLVNNDIISIENTCELQLSSFL